jgi:hypothetical protein
MSKEKTDGLQLEIGEAAFLDACYLRMRRPGRKENKERKDKGALRSLTASPSTGNQLYDSGCLYD